MRLMSNNYELTKSERLCSKKLIEALFVGGHKSMSAYPIRAVFMTLGEASASVSTEAESKEKQVPEACPHVQVMMSVSKRHFKHAVDRNRVKRQLREAYRLNKHLLSDKMHENERMTIAFIWLSDELFETKVIQNKMQKLLLRISEEKQANC